jgi:hypothetical protein
MIYRTIENPKCFLCKHATCDESSRNITCAFKGTVPMDYVCKKFDYDIFKREIKPQAKIKSIKFCKSDFEI